MTRKNQLGVLILLSALTMAIPYAIQGTLAMSKCPTGLDWWICAGDKYAWAIRAIIEGMVIGYIARTRTDSAQQAGVLWCFKVALLSLIVITLGPSLFAMTQGQTVQQVLNYWVLWVWTFGLAAYMPLMVAGAAYAYKVQPNDEGAAIVDSVEVAELESLLAETQAEVNNLENVINEGNADVRELRRELAEAEQNAQQTQATVSQLQAQLTTMQTEAKAVAGWSLLNATAKAKWIAQHTNGDRPLASHLADVLGCATSTVSRAYEAVDNGKAARG